METQKTSYQQKIEKNPIFRNNPSSLINKSSIDQQVSQTASISGWESKKTQKTRLCKNGILGRFCYEKARQGKDGLRLTESETDSASLHGFDHNYYSEN